MKHFAFALGARGIRVNAIASGLVAKDVEDVVNAERRRDHVVKMQALKRLARPEDIGGVVAFLASDDARWITGDDVRVDGGSQV